MNSLMSDYQTWFLVIFIRCEDNYVQIHYLDRNKTIQYNKSAVIYIFLLWHQQ